MHRAWGMVGPASQRKVSASHALWIEEVGVGMIQGRVWELSSNQNRRDRPNITDQIAETWWARDAARARACMQFIPCSSL